MTLLLDATDLLNSVKKAAVEAVKTENPMNLVFGEVISESPLKIKLEARLTLLEQQLIVPLSLTDFKVKMTVNHKTENKGGGSGDSAYESHSHDYKGKKEFLVHNALKKADKVMLLKMQGGQKYLVLDRVVK